MQIKSLAKMEKVVANLSHVKWDGWDLLVYQRNNAGWLKQNGAFKDGKWHVVTRIVPEREGWEVPDSWQRVL
jgi:hypothetical protein